MVIFLWCLLFRLVCGEEEDSVTQESREDK